MCNYMNCLINTVVNLNIVLVTIAINLLTVLPIDAVATVTVKNGQLFSEQETVENLVRDWAPLVWLAPGEKFMPGDVTEFLNHVHAEKAKIKSNPDEPVLSDDLIEQYYYDNELNTILSQVPNQWERRHKRTYRDKNYLLDYIIDLPVGEHSTNWFLVTNDDIDDLLQDSSSFIYGQRPIAGNVPIYAMVTMCGSTQFNSDKINEFDPQLNAVNPPHQEGHRSTYIPVSSSIFNRNYTSQNDRINNQSSTVESKITPLSSNKTVNREKRQTVDALSMAPSPSIIYPKDIKLESETRQQNDSSKYPHFHVTYWMFYPFSQGKTMCTLSLGPFGQLPIPQIFGMCLGTRKDFGSHVGDWEHMTLFFKGNKEPDEMYVSAHDAGAYYAYERLTGTFDFRRQETRKGILQHPNFPKTVITSANHPVLFSAEGSHGLWTAPGKHRFVRVARLFDINGFGTPWYTWKQVEISYENERAKRSIGPDWLQFNGRWGNPKSKCHPLKKVGLNFCEYSDGPTGIPVKTPHFYCQA